MGDIGLGVVSEDEDGQGIVDIGGSSCVNKADLEGVSSLMYMRRCCG